MSIILDIRSKEEYCKGHICNSFNIPTPLPPFTNDSVNNLQNNLKKFIKKNKIKKDVTIIVYCKKGIRAEKAKMLLHKLGVKNVINIGGLLVEPLKSSVNKLCKCK